MGNAHSTPDTVASNTPTDYPKVVQTKTINKKPQPFAQSFFESQIAAPLPHQQARKPNRSASHFNYFEAAAVTTAPAPSVRSQSSSKSSLKTSSTNKKSSLYPASSTINSTLERKPSTTSSTLSSSTSNSTVADRLNSLSLKTTKSDLANNESSDYVMVNNRRYWKGHGSQHFMLPCDDEELDRLMTLHYILKSTFHGNFTAPVHETLDSHNHKTKVLDIGCGSGTWILEMATEYPNAEFYGIDDCALFPTHIKPGNSHFKLHNVLKGLPFQDKEFDFVHMRMMVYYFTPEELSQLLTEISRVMKPGAYFQIVDSNYVVRHAGPITNKIVNLELKQTLHAAYTALTFTSQRECNGNHPIFSFLMLAPQQLSSSFVGNFIDICQEHSTLPLGDWGDGRIDELHSKNFQMLLSSVKSKREQQLPLTKDVIDNIIEECGRYDSYLDWFSCYAKKPPVENEETEQNTIDSMYEFVEGFVDV